VKKCIKTGCAGAQATCNSLGSAWQSCQCAVTSCPGDGSQCKTNPRAVWDATAGWSCTADPVVAGAACGNNTTCAPEQCDGAGSCVPKPVPGLDDGNACTYDSCDATGVHHAQTCTTPAAVDSKEAFSSPAVAPNPLNYAIPQMPSAGAPRVVESTGELTYHYSFQLPAARGRFQPELSVDYSSGSSVRTGVGRGWTMTAAYIEADSSAPPRSALLAGETRYWLEFGGRRSLLVKGSDGNYRTDLQREFVSFSLATDLSGKWTGTDLQGTQYQFWTVGPGGGSAGPSGRSFLSQVIDVDGNKVQYAYQEYFTGTMSNSGQWVFSPYMLGSISYNNYADPATTAETFATRVELVIDENLDSRVERFGDLFSWSGGLVTAVKIRSRSTRAGSTGYVTLLRHELGYRSLSHAGAKVLQQIQVLAGDSGGAALPPTTFDYQESTYRLADGVPGPAVAADGMWRDLDGDGLIDRVLPATGTWMRNITTRGAATLTFEGPKPIVGMTIRGSLDGPVVDGVATFMFPTEERVSGLVNADFIDLNADGIPDLVITGVSAGWIPMVQWGAASRNAQGLVTYSVATATRLDPGSSTPVTLSTQGLSNTAPDGTIKWLLADVSADGIPDFVNFDAGSIVTGGLVSSTNELFMGPSRVSVPATLLDINGDGLPGDYPYQQVDNFGWILKGLGAGTATARAWSVPPPRWDPNVNAQLAGCPLTNGATASLTSVNAYFRDGRQTVAYADLNGDGKLDLIWKPRPGDGVCPAVPCDTTTGSPTSVIYPTDPAARRCTTAGSPCPMVVSWNTGADFLAETLLSPAERAGAASVSDLYPSVQAYGNNVTRTPGWACI
jgi:hypothetical protein